MYATCVTLIAMRTGVHFARKRSKPIVSIGLQHGAKAALVGTPLALHGAIQYIKFDAPTLPPMAFTMFCLRRFFSKKRS